MRIISVILELFLYLIVGRFKAFNLSLYDFFDSSGINFVALFCIHSSLSTSVFSLSPHWEILHYDNPITKAKPNLKLTLTLPTLLTRTITVK